MEANSAAVFLERQYRMMELNYKEENEYSGNWLELLPLVSFAFFFLVIQIWQMHGFGRMALISHFFGVASAISYCILLLKINATSKQISNVADGFILGAGALVILLADKDQEPVFQLFNPLQTKVFAMLCASLIILMAMQAFVLIHNVNKIKLSLKSCKDLVLPAVFAIFFIAVGMLCLNLWPRWDSHTYYHDFLKKDLRNLFGISDEKLVICGHYSSAFILLGFLFKKITNLSVLNSLYLSNIFVLIINYVLVYKILKRTIKSKKSFLYTLLAFTFVCTPYLFGTTFNINPEHLAVTGVLLYLLGVIENCTYLCVIGCYIMCNSREDCVVVAAVMIFVQLIYSIIYKIKNRSYHFSWIYYFVQFLIGLSWFVSYQQGNWASGMANNGRYYYNDGGAAFVIRWSWQYILNQVKGILCTNFTWIFATIILFALIVLVLNKRNMFMQTVLRCKLSVILISGVLVATISKLIFITHHNYRYYTVTVSLIILIGIYSMVYLMSRFKLSSFVQRFVIGGIGLLMCAQCFATIDPVMLSTFPTITTGKGEIAYMPWNMNDLQGPEFLDNANYNFQIAAFDKALDKVFASINLENSKVLIYDGYQWGTLGNTMNSIWGRGYEFLDPPSWGVWNEEGQYRFLSNNVEPEDIINPVPVNSIERVDEFMQQYDELYYLEIPWGGYSFVDVLTEHYPDLMLCRSIENYAWRMNLYQIK